MQAGPSPEPAEGAQPCGNALISDFRPPDLGNEFPFFSAAQHVVI